MLHFANIGSPCPQGGEEKMADFEWFARFFCICNVPYLNDKYSNNVGYTLTPSYGQGRVGGG